ncbi:MAG: hypothetical protein QXH80_01360, partial [Candidatus Nanoarchaeia archaeon]
MSFILGAGVTSFVLFYFLLFGARLSYATIIALAGLSLFCVRISKAHLLLQYESEKTSSDTNKEFFSLKFFADLFLLLAIGVGIALISLNVIYTPLWDIDSFALWGLKAKVLYLSSLSKTEYFYREELGFSHLDYPLLMPLLSAGIYACYGEVCETAGKILCIPLSISIVFLLLSYASRRNIFLALLITALYSTLPAFLHWAGVGTAEIWLLGFYFVMLYFSLEFLTDKSWCNAQTGLASVEQTVGKKGCVLSSTSSISSLDRTSSPWRNKPSRGKDAEPLSEGNKSSRDGEIKILALVFLSALFLSFTKNEGLPISIIVLMTLVLFSVYKYGIKILRLHFVFWMLLFLAFLPWLYWSYDIPRIHENYPAQIKNIFLMEHIKRLPNILKAFGAQVINLNRWGIFWLLTVIACVWNFKCWEVKFLLAVMVLHLGMYIFIFTISPWDTEYLAVSALER